MRDFTQFSCFRRALLRLQLVWCLVTQQIASMERESHLIVQAKTRARGGVFNRFLDRLFNHRCPRWHSPFLQASQVLAVSCFGDIHFAMTARRGASIRTVVLRVWSWGPEGQKDFYNNTNWFFALFTHRLLWAYGRTFQRQRDVWHHKRSKQPQLGDSGGLLWSRALQRPVKMYSKVTLLTLFLFWNI